jgi:hypothetical protein
MGKPLAGSANAALDLVEHEQQIMLVTEHAQLAEEVEMGGLNTPLTLNAFQKDGGDAGVLSDGLTDLIDLIKW